MHNAAFVVWHQLVMRLVSEILDQDLDGWTPDPMTVEVLHQVKHDWVGQDLVVVGARYVAQVQAYCGGGEYFTWMHTDGETEQEAMNELTHKLQNRLAPSRITPEPLVHRLDLRRFLAA